MKLELCGFSGFKIYPGHGKRYIRADGKNFYYINHKCEFAGLKKYNPRKTDWTIIYRRLHRKGAAEEIAKRRSRRSKKFQRDIAGASIDVIKAKRAQKLEIRTKTQTALKAAKEKAKKDRAVKKTEKPKTRAPQQKTQQSKPAKVPKGKQGKK
eukprot:NODE_1996_length_677_cov_121.390909_g1946_i0.p1 GENE.NODE_1996_length_677_cov_121.390909_g1946_i0~~NODE_1996_length_677_cov_121.390909_g1946_i0.p1  ORF type:complete len:153 (+),score=47.66 NODE_1996_length_677_cov_121.390909_g1946_i0:112-570(+)